MSYLATLDPFISGKLATATKTSSTSGGYEAVEDKGRRRPVRSRTYHEDKSLNARKRRTLTATQQDAMRNFPLLGWIIRKHLDYVTDFTFQCKTDNAAFNDAVEARIAERSKRQNCHLSKRHSLRRLLRMAEARRVVDGDIGFEKIKGNRHRGALNTIEGDRIRAARDFEGRPDKETTPSGHEWINGVLVDMRTGESKRYAIAKRPHYESSQLIHDKEIPARNFYLHAYWDSTSRFDQVRGISPLASAINSITDISEGFDFTLMKLKVAKMFGLKITKETDSDDWDGSDDEKDTDSDGDIDKIDLDGGPFQLDLAPGEDADFLESKTPSTETVNFLKLMIHVSIKAIDLPYSFFDESHTNFFGSRGALQHYLRSCNHKIKDNQDLLNWITNFWLGIDVVDGLLELPPDIGFGDIKYEWIPRGVPWWDPAKEVRGHASAVAAHMDNLQAICRRTGSDFFENVQKNAEAYQYAVDAGVPIILPGISASDATSESDANDTNDANDTDRDDDQ